jgi:ADP-heptose:LPS heptosyltransferase
LVGLLNQECEITQIGMPGEKQLDGVSSMLVGRPLDELKSLIGSSNLWISVDNFLPHLANLIKKPGVVIFGPSDPLIFGHKQNINILKDRTLLREKQFDIWESCDVNDDRFYSPAEIMKIIKQSSISAKK